MTDFMRTALMIVTHTPYWVWVLYAGLLLLGLQRLRDMTVPLWRLLTLPAAVTILAITSVISTGPMVMLATALGLAVGGVAGWPLEGAGATRRLPDGRVWQRGEWLSLVQIMLVLIARYATNVVGVLDPHLGANPVWHVGSVFGCSLLSGLFLGRTAAKLRVYLAPVLALA